MGLSLGVINYCLKALAEKCLVKLKNFANSRNKFWYVYVSTPAGLAEKTTIAHRLLRRKMNECEVLKAKIEALRAEVENPGDERTEKA